MRRKVNRNKDIHQSNHLVQATQAVTIFGLENVQDTTTSNAEQPVTSYFSLILIKMLEFKPQFINGISIFPDDADPLLYYYLPVMPKLEKFQLIKYPGESSRGGLLNLEVSLSLPEKQLKEVQRNLGGEVKLKPIPSIAAQVSLLFFDRELPPRQPALYANQQTIFTVELDPEETLLLEQSLQRGKVTPLGIIYALDYLSLRPAYTFHLQANWERVQRRLEEKFSADAIFLQLEIERVVEDLIKQGLIVIELDTFSTEGIKDRDSLLDEIQAMVLHTFFTPRLQPIAMPKSNSISFLPGFSYRQIDMNQTDNRWLNVRVHEKMVVRKTLYPQGNLILADIDPENLVTILDDEDTFLRQRHLEVISRADFETDEIAKISVTLEYGNRIETVILTNSSAREIITWNGEGMREVKVKYRVSFQNGEADLESPETVTNSDFFEVVPRQLYRLTTIPIIAPHSIFGDRYDSVQVKTRYCDREWIFYLDQQQREQTWNLLIRDSLSPRFQYQISYQAALREDLVTPWLESENEILLHNPSSHKRSLQLISLVEVS